MEEKHLIALGTDDDQALKRERFGDSARFRIVSIEGGAVASTEIRINPFAEPAMENKPPKILELLNDCTLFVGRSWRAGSFALFTDNGKTVLLSDIERLDDIVTAIISKDFSRLKAFDLRAQKFVPVELL